MEILYYVISYYETYDKQNGISIKVVKKNENDEKICFICETEILDLKKQTHYSINVTAINKQGMSEKSNTLEIKLKV